MTQITRIAVKVRKDISYVVMVAGRGQGAYAPGRQQKRGAEKVCGNLFCNMKYTKILSALLWHGWAKNKSCV